MQTTPVEKRLHALILETEQLLPSYRANGDEKLGLDGLIAKEFQTFASKKIEEVKRLRDQVVSQSKEISKMESASWLKRWLTKDDLAKLRLARDKAEEVKVRYEKQLDELKRQHSTDSAVVVRVQDRVAQLALNKSARAGLEQIRDQAEALVSQIQRWKTRYGAVRPVLRLRYEIPELAIISDIDQVASALDVLRTTLSGRINRYASSNDAATQAQLVLDALKEHEVVDYDTAPEKFRQHTDAGLRRFLTFEAKELSTSSVLDELTRPLAFRLPETWLAFWTATAATVHYSTQSHETTISEGARTGIWSAEWRSQMANWSPDALNAIGLGKDNLSSLVCHLEDTRAEPKAGTDVLIMYDVSLGGRQYCRVAGLQFKQSNANDLTINIGQSKGRQRDTIIDLHHKSNGRWPGIYALLRPVAAGLASVPAVRIDSIIPHPEGVQESDGTSANSAPKSINWAELGQSLPTVLAHCLTEHTTEAFESVVEAFDWIESTADLELPSYLIVQFIGDRAHSLEYALTCARRLAKTHCRRFKILDEIRTRELKPKRKGKGNDHDLSW